MVEDIEDTPITPEKLAYYKDMIRAHDARKMQGKVKSYKSVEELHEAILSETI
jgi:hypothetical protein